MATKLETLIRRYCSENDVEVPPGFGRNTPGRYAIIRTDKEQAKLVATTWAREADVVYYIERLLARELGDDLAGRFRILDFKLGNERAYNGGKHLLKTGTSLRWQTATN